MIKSLVLTLFVAAAIDEGTPEQKARLRKVVMPAAQRYAEAGDAAGLVVAVRNVMGEDWVPQDPENQKFLISLGSGLLS